MINKKNILGKEPEEVGIKDAIHTAIVSVRAGAAIVPGQRCGLNEFREAVPNLKGPGVADPFLKGNINRGQRFWLLLNQTEVPNVRHEWDHPTVDFSPPTRDIVRNASLESFAKLYDVTYDQLMSAAAFVVSNHKSAAYPKKLSEEKYDEIQEAIDNEMDEYELWTEWADETLYEFDNMGSECCPEYEHPDCRLFDLKISN